MALEKPRKVPDQLRSLMHRSGLHGSPQTVTQVARQALPDDASVDTEPTDDIPRSPIGEFRLLAQRAQVCLFPDTSDDPPTAQPHQDRSTRVGSRTDGECQRETGGGDGKGEAEE